jgi:hypothetical protein
MSKSNSTIHFKIYQDFKQFSKNCGNSEENGQPLSKEEAESIDPFKNFSYEEFCKAVFIKWTKHWPSLRCTTLGANVLKNMYEVWMIEWDPNREKKYLTPACSVALHRRMKVPYYIDQKGIMVWGQEPALEFSMANGNIDDWVKMF